MTSCQEAPNLPARSVTIFAVIVRGFCAQKDSRKMPDRCVVVGCSNTPNAEKGIAFYQIPFFGDNRGDAKARRKRWTDFVKKWTATATSVVCSCHFAKEDFARRLSFGDLKQQRNTLRRRVDPSNSSPGELACLFWFGLISLFKCEMPANSNFITCCCCFATGFPTYYDLYFRRCSLLHLLL